MKAVSAALALSSLAGRVVAWGAVGHEAVGYVAQAFLAPNALDFVQTSLGSKFNESLGPAGPWADEIKSNHAYDWSSALHYVDAEDSPPSSCSVDEERDCADGKCILTAIANYTSRVVDQDLTDAEQSEALKFLDHFIGDLGQPLHVEATKVGGNEIKVKCNGKSTNLHSLWDSGIITVLLNGKSAESWASDLAKRIKSGGVYASQASDWITCADPSATLSRRDLSLREDIWMFLESRAIKPLKCPLEWAKDANSYDCSTVFTYKNGSDLCTGSYYDDAVKTIELQVAKQGYRLAAWLNVLFDGDTNL
ncbi:S1/P1 nuclease [Schizophyllum commune H4-8]|uniref:S1/P1 nuclease n=1 Tax=Schizophyllum commune (strain H4-8 / FGSC 9210) TaxID=578458 RepID=UPI00215E09C4|nr:S1/P1 nuclease [Schizophyllum commune H4-8]KAI5897470.1 S1/P1 nuclease [Schizophyllum commune H4-8]